MRGRLTPVAANRSRNPEWWVLPVDWGADGATVFAVHGSLSGLLGVVGGYGFPRVVVGYLLVLAWLRYREGAVLLRATLFEGPAE